MPKLQPAQIFKIEKSYLLLVKASVFMCAAMAVMSGAIPFIPDSSSTANCAADQDPTVLYIISFLGAAFFGSLGGYCYHILKRIPLQAIAADDDGLWYAHQDKAVGLVPWRDITKVKERKILQRLELLDVQGTARMKLENQLVQFGQLRDLVIKQIAGSLEYPQLPVTYGKAVSNNVLMGVALAAVFLAGLYIGEIKPLIGYLGAAFFATMTGYQYLTSIYKIVVTPEQLFVHYPTVTRTYSYSDIDSIQIIDQYDQGRRSSEVCVFLKQAKAPLRMGELGIDAISLHGILTKVASSSTQPREAKVIGDEMFGERS